jgi:NAD(P)H dehydrogenase (quinone)
MNVLVVLAHPNRDSFTGGLVDNFVEGLAEAGHGATVADLYREGFDPCFTTEDMAHYNGAGEASAATRAEHARLDAADGLVLAFPVWWWSMPAMLKGWVDRTFTGGYAYDYIDGKTTGKLADRPVLILAAAATDAGTYAKYGYDKAVESQIDTGIMRYCGLSRITTRILHDVGDDAAIIEGHLAEAKSLGRGFLPGSG